MAGPWYGSPMLRSTICLALCGCALACSGDKSDEPPAPGPTVAPTATPTRTTTPDPAANQLDPRTGLVMADGFAVVAATCTTCHSGRLVAQNRGTRRDWDERLRWMQKNHNLWDLPPETRATILDYLASNYGIDDDAARHQRRRPLPAHLMPPDRAELAARAKPAAQ